MGTTYIRYPSSSGGGGSSPSVGPVGSTAPGFADLVAGVAPGDILTPLSVDSSGNLNVNVVGGGGSGGATAANQTNGSQKTQLVDGSGDVLGPFTLASGVYYAPVALLPSQVTTLTPPSTVTVTQATAGNLNATVFQGTSPWVISGSTKVSGTVAVSNFPATQPISGTVTANAGTGTFQTNVTNASIPVTQGTNPWVVSGSTTVSGTITANQGTSPWVENVAQFGGNNVVTGTGAGGVGIPRVTVSNDSNILATQSGAWTTGRTWTLLNTTDSVNAVQSGTWTTGRTWTLSSGTDSVNVGNFPASQSVTQGTSPWVVSGTVTANIGTTGGLALDSSLTTINTTLGSPLQNSGGTVAVTQTTAANLNATVYQGTSPWVVSGSTTVSGTVAVSNFPATQPVSGTVDAIATTPTALTIYQAALTVGTTAVRLTVSGSAPASTRVVLVGTPDMASTATFYIGSSTVTNSGSTRGIEFVAGQAFVANNDAGDYWIVSSASSQTVAVMEQY